MSDPTVKADSVAMNEQAKAPVTIETESSAQVAPLGHGRLQGPDPFDEFCPDPFAGAGTCTSPHRISESRAGKVRTSLETIETEVGNMKPIMPQLLTEVRIGPASMPENGRYSVQSASMSSFVGSDGKLRTEQYASSEVGHRDHGIREMHQAYSDPCSGIHKRALEQHLGDCAVKTVKLWTARSPKADTKEMFLGVDGTAKAKEAFSADFSAKAGHLPEHRNFNDQFFSSFWGGIRGGA
eukprot:TRINITY_DN25787_c1_g1_i2.p1 TRINITY_DN25787_c1_g1~~TRINITY_DN25787_c1_g1_i2.p1  ORF type:complete len:253 (+),score=54.49 TRINITY_DN25787_c1_g1_i2:44-760(+)